MSKKPKRVTIWRNWGLKGDLASQIRVARAAQKKGYTRNHTAAVRQLSFTNTKG